MYLVFPARAPTENLTDVEILLGIEPEEDRSAAQQAGFQLALLASTLVLAIVGGLLTGQSHFDFLRFEKVTVVLFVGVIVGCCPMFQHQHEDCLFDDKPYWKVIIIA